MGYPFLHINASKGNLKEIRTMIERGDYNPLNKDENGNTAIHCAAMNGHLHVVKYFVEDLGCNPTLPGVKNCTILHIAAVKSTFP